MRSNQTLSSQEAEYMTTGLHLISIGLYDEKDLSLRALEEARNCDVLYAEMYTTKLETTIERLSDLIGKPIEALSRSRLEEASGALLDESELFGVGILIGGDCLAATTHISLLIEARRRGIPTHIINGSSILTAIAQTGLSIYKFGRTVTLPLPDKGPANTILDTVKENMVHGLHTLILLDLDAEKSRYLTIREAASILMETDKPHIFNGETLIVGVARLGSDEPVIKAEKARKIVEMGFGVPPHSIVIPGSLHFMEVEALKVIGGCPEEAFERHHKPLGRLEYLIEKYLVSCSRALERLKLRPLPFEVGEAAVKDLIAEAERYLKDAEYYAQEWRATALASVCYSEGILDALRLLGLVEFEW